jgi:hypothetical protein
MAKSSDKTKSSVKPTKKRYTDYKKQHPTDDVNLPDLLNAGRNRLIDKADVSASRFRKRYRNMAAHELMYGDAIKDTAAQLEYLIAKMGPASLYSDVALLYLETAVMYAIKQQTGKPVGMQQAYTEAEIKRILNQAKRIKAD